MRWVADTTGRFAQRPHYAPAEIDAECEGLVDSFLRERRGRVEYPFETNDLIALIEREAEDLDIYADLTSEGQDVEGATYFNPQGRARVRISRRLADEPWSTNRFRTTASHELGHVKFHNFLWPLEPRPALFYADEAPLSDVSPRCKRDAIQPLKPLDWMEWQAGYACGALLMPLTRVQKLARTVSGLGLAPRVVGTPETLDLISLVKKAFEVSADAARVRLIQLRLLAPAGSQTSTLPLA
jgi:hypothetical protein